VARSKPIRWGAYELFEPVDLEQPWGPWLARADGTTDLVEVTRLAPSATGTEPDVPHPEIERLTHPHINSLLARTLSGPAPMQVTEHVFGVRSDALLDGLRAKGAWIPAGTFRAWCAGVLEACTFLERKSQELKVRVRPGGLRLASILVTFWGQARIMDHGLLGGPATVEGTGVDSTRKRKKADLRDIQQAARLFHAWSARAFEGQGAPEGLVRVLHGALDDRPSFETMAAFAFALRPELQALGPETTESERAAWMKAHFESEANQVLERLRRVAGQTRTQAPAAAEPTDPSFDLPPEPLEPSVITMPGMVLEPGPSAPAAPSPRSGASSRSSRDTRSRFERAWPPLAVVAVVVGGLMWWTWRGFEPAPAAPQARPAPVVPLPIPETQPPSLRADSVPPAPPPRPAAPAPRRRVARRRGTAETPAPASTTADPTVELLRAVRAAPDDHALFERALRQLRARAREKPEPQRSRILAAVRRAEFSWSVEDLAAAVERLHAHSSAEATP
jgi:hypothetical protein